MSRTLAEAAAEASGCVRCRLSETRTQVVFGVGDPDADLLFIGEAPGMHEDRQGEPFVGAAGQLLTRMLGEIGLTRDEVYIANVLKCRPPANRDPLPDEIETCTPWLVEQISLIQPAVIATLGNFATKFVLQTQRGITSMRGIDLPVARTPRDPHVPSGGGAPRRRGDEPAVPGPPRRLPAHAGDARRGDRAGTAARTGTDGPTRRRRTSDDGQLGLF